MAVQSCVLEPDYPESLPLCQLCLLVYKMGIGISMCCSRLRIQWSHSCGAGCNCGMGLIPGPGTSTCLGRSQRGEREGERGRGGENMLYNSIYISFQYMQITLYWQKADQQLPGDRKWGQGRENRREISGDTWKAQGVIWMFTLGLWWCFHECTHPTKGNNLCTLNMCSLLYINSISIPVLNNTEK